MRSDSYYYKNKSRMRRIVAVHPDDAFYDRRYEFFRKEGQWLEGSRRKGPVDDPSGWEAGWFQLKNGEEFYFYAISTVVVEGEKQTQATNKFDELEGERKKHE